MVVLIWGENEHLIRQQTIRLVEQLRSRYPKSGNYYVDCQEEREENTLRERIVSRGIFDEGKRIVIAKNVFQNANEEEIKGIISIAKDDADVMLIIATRATKTQEKSSLGIILKESAYKAQQCIKYNQTTALNQMRKKASQINLVISESLLIRVRDAIGAQKVGNYIIGYDMDALENELHRLSMLKKPITQKIIEQLYEYRKTATIGELTNAIKRKESAATIFSIWENILFSRVEPVIILQYMAKATDDPELTKKLLEADKKLKSGLLDPDQALVAHVLL